MQGKQSLMEAFDVLDQLEDMLLEPQYWRQLARVQGFSVPPLTWMSEGQMMAINWEQFAGPKPDVNMIPGGPLAPCFPTLIVCIGVNDNIEATFQQALQHLHGCPNDKGNVIFWASKWSSHVWTRYTRRFELDHRWLQIVGSGKSELDLPR